MNNATVNPTDVNAFMYGLLTSDTSDTDVSATLADMKDAIVGSITAQCSRIFQLEIGADELSCELARAALDAYFSAAFGTISEEGSCDHVLNTYRSTIRDLASKMKSAKKRTAVMTNFTKIVRHGTGSLVKTAHVNKNGDALYAVDEKMSCVTLDRGQYKTISNSQRKAVKARYIDELRNTNLLSPSMYRDFLAREKMNWLQFVLSGADKVRKTLDDDALARFNRMLEREQAIEAAEARKAEQAEAV